MLVQRWIIMILMVGCGVEFDESIPPCEPDLECQSDEDCSPEEGCHPLYCRCLPYAPDDAGVESEAEAEAESEGEDLCGDGECGFGEDAVNCSADCGCQAREACACGVAPFGCFCGPGCLESGTCCQDADACGVSAKLGFLTEGCGDTVCGANETCAICPSDCGLCAMDACPPPSLIISYEIGDDEPASEITIQARFSTEQGVGEWQQVANALDAIQVALAIPVPADAVALDVWIGYTQANGRGRASCEGMKLFIPVGVLQVTRTATLLVESLVSGGAGEPGNCAHRYELK